MRRKEGEEQNREYRKGRKVLKRVGAKVGTEDFYETGFVRGVQMNVGHGLKKIKKITFWDEGTMKNG